MLGAIAGDVIGSVYERMPVRHTEFELFPRRARFTDDTVMTVATAQAILDGRDYREAFRDWGRRYPAAGYGPRFKAWLRESDPGPLGSLGNGSAMRVSPVGLAFNTEAEVLREAARSAECSHDHPEGVRGAQAVALGVFMARSGATRNTIRQELQVRFGYDLNRTIVAIRPTYRTGPLFDMSCEGSVPEAIIAFLDSNSYEQAVRLAVSLAGDSDPQACIAGSLAAAAHGGVPPTIAAETRSRLSDDILDIVDRFEARFTIRGPAQRPGSSRFPSSPEHRPPT